MTIYSFKNRPEPVLEKNSGRSKVEKVGYIPANVQITNLLRAGQRLNDFRRQNYDSFDENEPMLDPTRKKDFDLADASELARSVEPSLLAAEKALKTPKQDDKPAEQVEVENPETTL